MQTIQKQLTVLITLGLGIFSSLYCQEEENLGTETVTVVKAYTPTVSDAFKVKSVPVLNDSIELQKKKISYSIFSIPVASTFTPSKGKATVIQRAAPEKLYNSYAMVSFGNFGNALADFYTSRDLDRGKKRLDFGLKHHSSRGDLENVPLNTDFYNTLLSGAYTERSRDMGWTADLGFQHQKYNWYGVEEGSLDEAIINGIEEGQNYFAAEAGARVTMDDSFFTGGDLRYRRFWDAASSGENRFYVRPNFEFPLSTELLKVAVVFDYVGGSFENASLNSLVNSPGISYGQLQFGVSPNIELSGDSYALSLGASLVYGLDVENSDSNFYIYPQVSGSYTISDNALVAYAGVEGRLVQNSYYDFVALNPYVSPTLTIQPTDQQYDGFAGIRGQVLTNLSYNVRASYKAENRKPLYKLNPLNSGRTDSKGYYWGNSFEVFYDDVKTLGLFAELSADINRSFTIGVNGEFFDYNTETDNPAWNLPEVQGSLFFDYQIDEQWYIGANLFFVGERNDLSSEAVPNTLPQDFPSTILTLDSFFDANAYAGYRASKQLTIFAKANNIANNDYQRWANFRVQGFQILAGASYKFDF
ncbi:TonB-dependent receptor [Eudoraea chungangensis]|uniref:TonB-dependent receptor n=1 Tax=Eudoraea chungangensis TaxID=1481905 RepID=UPI0023EBA0A7|nr:TonB-dependent receptor [Eudoraea chungangensis]